MGFHNHTIKKSYKPSTVKKLVLKKHMKMESSNINYDHRISLCQIYS